MSVHLVVVVGGGGEQADTGHFPAACAAVVPAIWWSSPVYCKIQMVCLFSSDSLACSEISGTQYGLTVVCAVCWAALSRWVTALENF